MFDLEATEAARSNLRALRGTHPELFTAVARRIAVLRADPGGPRAGRAFLLDDGSVARLTTVHAPGSHGVFALVWTVVIGEAGPAMRLVAAEIVG